MPLSIEAPTFAKGGRLSPGRLRDEVPLLYQAAAFGQQFSASLNRHAEF